MVAACCLSLPVIAMTSLLDNRLPGTHDAYLHLLRLINAAVNLHEGVIIPRWGPHLHFGFGYPLGNFYAPGWHIVGGGLVWAGLPAVTVWLLVQSIALMLYPLGGYVFARLFAGRAGALLGAAAFLFVPIRFYEVFVQGNLSQFIAMGLIVWVLWAVARCALSPGPGRITVAGVLIALLLWTHHPTSAYAIPFAALYASVVAFAAPGMAARWRAVVAVVAAFVLGLLLSAAYWLPALAEIHNANVEGAAGQYQLINNFIPRAELFGPVVPPDRGALNLPFTFSMGWLLLALTGIGGMLALWPRIKASGWARGHAIGGACAALVGLYLMTYPSLWVWDAIPEADLILFPWRLMGVVAAALVPPVAFVITALPDRWRPWGAALLTAGLFVAVLPLMFPVYDNAPDLGPVTPVTSLTYEIESGNLGAVANNEYLPRWASERPDWLPCVECYADWGWHVFPAARSIPGGATVQPVASDHRRGSAFTVTTAEPFQFELRQLYFPGWQASVDGDRAAITITEPQGLLAVDVPAGTHTVAFWYVGTTMQHVADGLTLVGLVVAGAFVSLSAWRRSRTPSLRASLPRTMQRLGTGVTVTAIVSAVLLRAVILPQTGWFRHASDVTDPAGMQHRAAIVFEDAAQTPVLELIGYSLSQPDARAEDWVVVDLYWRALTAIDEAWQVKLALVDPTTRAEIAASYHGAPGGFSTQHWSRDQFVVDSHILRLESPPPYVYHLVVEVYNADNVTLTAAGHASAAVTTLRVVGRGERAVPETSQSVNIVFGDWLRLRAYEWQAADLHQLTLYWEVLRAPAQEYALMLHFMRDGQSAGNADQPPLPSYPTQLWQAGQFLVSTIPLDVPPDVETLAVGFYDRASVGRVTVDVRSGAFDVQDRSLLLPVPPED